MEAKQRAEERVRNKQLQQAQRISRKESGFCPECGRPAEAGKIRCTPCLDKDREARRIANAKVAEAGLCRRCRLQSARVGVFCEECWYRARAQSTTGSNQPWEALRDLLVAQNFRCAYSGELLELGNFATLDHKIPRSRGGSDEIENLQWVSKQINQMKTDFTHDEFIAMCETVIKLWKNRNQLPSESPLKLIKSCVA